MVHLGKISVVIFSGDHLIILIDRENLSLLHDFDFPRMVQLSDYGLLVLAEVVIQVCVLVLVVAVAAVYGVEAAVVGFGFAGAQIWLEFLVEEVVSPQLRQNVLVVVMLGADFKDSGD